MSADKQILTCPQCGRKMRVPVTDSVLKVTCPDCRHMFEHGAASPPAASTTADAAFAIHDEPPAPSASSRPDDAPPAAPATSDDTLTLGTILVAVATGLALGVWLGGAPFGIWPEIDSVGSWLWQAGVTAVLGAPIIGIAAFLLGMAVSIPLQFVSDRVALAAVSLCYAIGLALWVALPAAFTWAWLGHGSDWREAPYQWTLEQVPELAVAMHELEPSGGSTRTAATTTNPPSSAAPVIGVESTPERDKYLLGIADAVKAGRHAEVAKLIEALEASGGDVPSAVRYFQAESLTALGRFMEARFAVKDYLRQGSAGRYYEEALKVELRIDQGIDELKQQWRSAYADLAGALVGGGTLNTQWTLQTPDAEFDCVIDAGTRIAVKTERNSRELLITRDAESVSGRTRCRVSSGDRSAWAHPGNMEFSDSVYGYQHLTIPVRRLREVRIDERRPSCDDSPTPRYNVRHCPHSMPRYSVVSLDDEQILLFQTGLSSYFSRAADLYRQLGGDVQ